MRTRKVTISDHKLTLTMGIFDEYTMLNYLDVEAANPAVSNLRITQASAGGGSLTLTLGWTSPSSAASTTIHYSANPITAANWDSASILTASLPGSQTSYTASVPYSGGTLFFAAKRQNAQGEWSGLSNLVFWPSRDTFLPVVRR